MDTRESLLDVTAKLYAEHGWRGTTTRRIAEAAGVNEVTVFRQFGSKESLLLQAIRHASDDSSPAALPADPGDLRSELVAWALAHHRSIRDKRGIILSCLAEAEERPALGPQACEGGRLARADVTAYLGAAHRRGLITRGDLIDAAASMLMRSVFMDAMTRDLVPEMQVGPLETVLAAQVELLLRGLDAAAYA